MTQTRKGSFVEAWANIAVGFTINYIANLVILPAFGFTSLTPGKNFLIGVVYTAISLIRQFVIRRWFNGLRFGNKISDAEALRIVSAIYLASLEREKAGADSMIGIGRGANGA